MRIKKTLALVILVAAMVFAVPANAQFTAAWSGGCAPTTATAPMSFALDLLTGIVYSAGNGTGYVRQDFTLGVYQGVTATAITDANFNTLTGATAIKIPTGVANCANAHIRVRGSGVYTNAAASLLNVQLALCQVQGCASGTVVTPAGCLSTSTNQANNLTNGQFTFVCDLSTATTGTAGTLMAKSVGSYQLGAATTAALSAFADTATAVSAAVNLTVAEFFGVQFKFSTGNAGNTVTLQQVTAELVQ